MKPVKGGRPPKDNKEVNKIMDISGNFIISGARVLILVELIWINIRNTEVVKIIYNIRLSSVRLGI